METRKKRSSEEIDLLYFFAPLFKGGWNAASGYLLIIRRKIFIFLTIFVLVALAGFSLRYILPAYYKTSASFISLRLPAGFYDMQIAQLDNLAGERNDALLAEELHIPAEVARNIKSINMEAESNNIYMSVTDTMAASAFKIDLVMTNISGIEQIQQGILQYLENNEFLLRRKVSRKKTLELLKKDLVEKMKGLDSLKEIVSAGFSQGKSGQVIVLGESVIPVAAYELQTRYLKEQLEIDRELSLLDDVEVVRPFHKTTISTIPDFKRLFKYGILAGLILAMIVTPLIGKNPRI